MKKAVLFLLPLFLIVLRLSAQDHNHDGRYAIKQSGFTDATADRGLIVGAFGLGGIVNMTDIDDFQSNKTGIYRIISATAGTKPLSGSMSTAMLLNLDWYKVNNNHYASQLYINSLHKNLFFRTLSSNNWDKWQEVFHSGNSNNPSSDWTARDLEVARGIQISNNSSGTHIGLGRNSANYILANGGSNSYIAFTTGNRGIGVSGGQPSLVLKANKDSYFNGSVAIGTTDPKGHKLAVAGKVIAEEVVVKLQSQWPDYVFKPEYTLRPLAEVEAHIQTHGHLPEVPSAQQVEESGIGLGQMNALLLKKVEELTLYSIEQERKLKRQNQRIEELERQNLRIEELESLIKGVLNR